jgi:serine/threonine protein kinase/predicted Zn-dependent protease
MHADQLPSLEVLLDEQSQCWLRGERLPVEAYLAVHPDLRGDAGALLDLIYHEILLRTRHGDRPALAEYLGRFPQFGAELRAQFDVHHALFPRASLRPTLLDPVPPRGAPARLPAVPGYEVVGELGRGGMGVVYKARQLGLNRWVALKMIQSRAHAGARPLARFRREAEALGRLRHPNIIQVYEVGEYEGAPFFSLELVTGGSLDRKLQGVPQPPAAAAQLLETLARAIHAAHQAGIVHRDLKPANVLLAAVSGQRSAVSPEAPAGLTADRCSLTAIPKITDFGLAKQLDADTAHTRSGDILGTPSYMAPEQAQGRAVGPAADVYSLGAILYECLTGRPPFVGESVWDTLEQAVSREPVPPRQLQPRVPRDLETITLKCLHKDPAQRYASALDLADDLARFRHGEPTRARPTPPWERAWKWARRRPAPVAAAAATLVVLVALLGLHQARLDARVRAALRQADAEAARRRRTELEARAERKLPLLEADLERRACEKATAELDDLLPALRQAATDADDRLAQLLARAERLKKQVRQRLTARERYHALGAYRDDAVCFDQLMGFGRAGGAGRLRLRRLVADALQLFHTAVESGAPLGLGDADFTEEQKRHIREGCCELLLTLARAEAEALPGEGPDARRRQAARALRVLDRVARLGVPTAGEHWCRADCLAHLGQGAAAERQRQLARAFRPRTAFDFFLRGTDLYHEGRLAEAISHFERAVNRQGDHFEARYALAVCHLKLPAAGELHRAHLNRARDNLTVCIQQQPHRIWPYLLRGFAHGELSEFEAALADYSHVEQALRPRDRTAHYGVLVNRGALRIRQGDLTRAVADLTAAIQLEPDAYPAYVNLARAYQGQNKEREAGLRLDRAIALKPPQALAAIYRTRARWHQRRGDLTAALGDLGQAIGHDPQGPTSPAALADRVERGRLLLQLDRPAEALAELDAALAKEGALPEAHRLRAEALTRLGRPAEAVAALDRYLALGRGTPPLRAAAYRARGRAHARAGNHFAAVEDYTQALGLESDAATLVLRGWAHLAVESALLAERDFDRALRLDPREGALAAEAYSGRGTARVKLGRYRDGALDAEEAARRGEALYQAARVLALAARAAGADPGLPRAEGRERGQAYQRRALTLLRQALDRLPSDRRGDFWARTVRRDSAWAPQRHSDAFARLARRYTSFGRESP